MQLHSQIGLERHHIARRQAHSRLLRRKPAELRVTVPEQRVIDRRDWVNVDDAQRELRVIEQRVRDLAGVGLGPNGVPDVLSHHRHVKIILVAVTNARRARPLRDAQRPEAVERSPRTHWIGLLPGDQRAAALSRGERRQAFV